VKYINLVLLLLLSISPGISQVQLLNEVIALMIGPPECEHIPVFESMSEVCASEYISCDESAEKIIGLNFQFTNLNGVMPESITQFRTGNASQWVVNRLNYNCENWTSGYQRNEPVRVQYTLPVKFKLQ